MNRFKKMRKQFRDLFDKREAEIPDAVARLDRNPTVHYHIDPHTAAYVEQPLYQQQRTPLPFVEDRAASANVRDISALQYATEVADLAQMSAGREQPLSRLNGPFTPEYPLDRTASIAKPFGRSAEREQSGLRRPLHPMSAPPAASAYQAPVWQKQPPSTIERAAPDPFSLVDLQNALPPFQTPAVAVTSTSHALGSPPTVPALPGPGTYGNRYREQGRLGIRAYGIYECEHVVGYSVAHPDVRRTSPQGIRLEGGMPAYYEPFQLHQEHAGSGENDRVLDPKIHGGWRNPSEYRRDQRQTLQDPVARKEGTSVSNAYQLNALGYGHILMAETRELCKPSIIPKYLLDPDSAVEPEPPPFFYMPEQDAKAADSFGHTVRHDPPIIHRLNGKGETVRLGLQGQAEALLAHGAAKNHIWPSDQAIANVARELLPPPAYKEKQDDWAAAGAHLPDPPPPPPYRARDRQRETSMSII